MSKKIESAQNKIIKYLTGLQLRKNRERESVFVAEGIRFVSEIPKNWHVVLYAVSQQYANEHEILKLESRAPVYILTDVLFEKVSATEQPQGILAVVEQQNFDTSVAWENKNAFLLLAEEMNDPGNLGTIIRTADACNVDAVFLSKGSVDLYHPKTVRATMGSIFHIPVIQNVDLAKTAELLQEKGIPLYAAHLQGKQYPYGLNLRRACAFMVGNEARGLSEQAASLCDSFVKLPIPGKAESLNVSVAAGVLLYEVVRQRVMRNLE